MDFADIRELFCGGISGMHFALDVYMVEIAIGEA